MDYDLDKWLNRQVMRCGFINESGYLRAREVDEQSLEKFLSAGWKIVDEIDGSQLNCEDGYVVKIKPYDAGDRISFSYEKVVDVSARRDEIERLKTELSGSDYKVIKCYEANMLGEDLPYNAQELHQERQILRDRINALERELESL